MYGSLCKKVPKWFLLTCAIYNDYNIIKFMNNQALAIEYYLQIVLIMEF